MRSARRLSPSVVGLFALTLLVLTFPMPAVSEAGVLGVDLSEDSLHVVATPQPSIQPADAEHRSINQQVEHRSTKQVSEVALGSVDASWQLHLATKASNRAKPDEAIDSLVRAMALVARAEPVSQSSSGPARTPPTIDSRDDDQSKGIGVAAISGASQVQPGSAAALIPAASVLADPLVDRLGADRDIQFPPALPGDLFRPPRCS